jgi:hypothetical protein
MLTVEFAGSIARRFANRHDVSDCGPVFAFDKILHNFRDLLF